MSQLTEQFARSIHPPTKENAVLAVCLMVFNAEQSQYQITRSKVSRSGATRTIFVSKLIGHHCRDQQHTGCREECHNTEHRDISATRDYSISMKMSPD
jgi:hypothetical protein